MPLKRDPEEMQRIMAMMAGLDEKIEEGKTRSFPPPAYKREVLKKFK